MRMKLAAALPINTSTVLLFLIKLLIDGDYTCGKGGGYFSSALKSYRQSSPMFNLFTKNRKFFKFNRRDVASMFLDQPVVLKVNQRHVAVYFYG